MACTSSWKKFRIDPDFPAPDKIFNSTAIKAVFVTSVHHKAARYSVGFVFSNALETNRADYSFICRRVAAVVCFLRICFFFPRDNFAQVHNLLPVTGLRGS